MLIIDGPLAAQVAVAVRVPGSRGVEPGGRPADLEHLLLHPPVFLAVAGGEAKREQDLVGDGPMHDRRMVAVRLDHLPHVVLEILPDQRIAKVVQDEHAVNTRRAAGGNARADPSTRRPAPGSRNGATTCPNCNDGSGRVAHGISPASPRPTWRPPRPPSGQKCQGMPFKRKSFPRIVISRKPNRSLRTSQSLPPERIVVRNR